MRDLLVKDEFRRLGSRAGAGDVKNHLFFKNVQWALLRNSQPPIIPVLSRSCGEKKDEPDALGLCNFRNLRESESLELENEIVMEEGTADSNPFHDFETLKISRS